MRVPKMFVFFTVNIFMHIALAFGNSLFAAFACGSAFAPTSVALTLKMLGDRNQLSTQTGQTILSAAFLDDVFSIILFVAVITIGLDHSTPIVIIRVLFAVLFLLAAMFLAIKVYPLYVEKWLSLVFVVYAMFFMVLRFFFACYFTFVL